MIGRVLGALIRRTPTLLLLLGLAVAGLARLGWAVARRWWLACPLAAVGCCWWLTARYGSGVLLVLAVLVVVVGVLPFAVACYVQPQTWAATVEAVRSWRRGRHYRARWDDAMEGAGLVRAGVVPTLMSCRGGKAVDELLVHMAPGSLLTEWRDAAPRLASAFEVRSVRVRRDGPRDVRLLVRHSAVTRHEWSVDVDTEVDEVAAQIAADIEAEPVKPATGGAFPRRPR